MKDRDSLEKKIFEKSTEVSNLLTKIEEMEVSHSVKMEELHFKFTEERNQDMETRYNTVIEELYTQIQDWEAKFKLEVKIHQERMAECEVKHSKYIDMIQQERMSVEKKLRQEMLEQVTKMTGQISDQEKTHSQATFKIHQEFYSKETNLLKKIEELSMQRDQQSVTEKGLKLKIAKIEEDNQAAE
jgi:hypothetical protein